MRLVTFIGKGSRERLGALVAGGVLDLADAAKADAGTTRPPAWSRSMLDLLEAGERGMEAARQAVASAAKHGVEPAPQSDVTLCAPLARPPSLRDFMSFEHHLLTATRRVALGPLGGLDEKLAQVIGGRWSLAGLLNRSFYERPAHYTSNPRVVVGPEAEVRIPAYSKRFDYELEWAVVIGREGIDIPAERAREHIAGYTIFNDFSARDEQAKEMRGRLGPSKGKNFETGNALGPCLATPDEVGDPYDLTMVARINGQEWSRGNTGEAYWTFEQLIEHLSRSERLYPGDVIGSGTCSGREGLGCGLEHGRYLSPGDVIELEVDRIGVLRNRIVAAS